jgi:hypothetical protein
MRREFLIRKLESCREEVAGHRHLITGFKQEQEKVIVFFRTVKPGPLNFDGPATCEDQAVVQQLLEKQLGIPVSLQTDRRLYDRGAFAGESGCLSVEG